MAGYAEGRRMQVKKDMIRLLKAEEIECRVSAVNEKGVSLLLYKDARVDQRILDETFGIFGWKRSHQTIDGNLYCTVEIYDKESGEWVAKQDVGTAGYTEKEKSLASDSFKRACFNWGIGRELYSAPFIWIPAGKTEIQKKGDRYFCSDRFRVNSIECSPEKEITGLKIVSERGATVYELRGKKENAVGQEGTEPLQERQMKQLQAELDRTGVALEAVLKRYGIRDVSQMSEETYEKALSGLRRTRAAGKAA